MSTKIVFSISLLISLIFNCSQANDAPMIGILTKPLNEEYEDIKTDYSEVIESKYVHFIEGGGGRVVPISYKWDSNKIREVMSKLNGVLFTGGATELTIFENDVPVDLTEYSKGAKRVMDIAIEMNNNGIYFPVWGTCLGYELMLILESENIKLLGHCRNCSNYETVLKYNHPEFEKGKIFIQGFSAYQLHIMETQNLTYNNHMWMVDNSTFYENPLLVEKYRILAYSPWWNETTLYIAAVEHKKYPFFAIQFHPEKWNYEVSPTQKVTKTRDTIALGHGFSIFFVGECKKNDNKFANYEEELKYIVYNAASYYHPKFGHLHLLGKKTTNTDS